MKHKYYSMYKSIIFLIVLIFVSCGSTSKVRTQKNETAKKTIKVEKHISVDKPITNSEVLVATSKVKATAEDVKLYILQFDDVSKTNMIRFGIPASITLAQGILESGAGYGKLCKEANNHFGIKCHTGWNGDKVYHDDDAAQECFRKYNNPEESYIDHSQFLVSRKRYANLFSLDKGDYKSWALGLKNAGYATDPGYPEKLIGIIERYELYKLDNEILKRNYVPITTYSSDVKYNEYEVQKGDTLYSISKKFNISVNDLILLNNIIDNAIQIGQKLKIKA